MLRAITILLVASAPLQAQGSLADLVPPSTPLLIEYEELDGKECENLALARICAEPEVRRFIDGMKAAMAKGIAGQRARGPDFFTMAGLAPQDFLGIRVRRAGAALVAIDPERGGFPDAVAMVELRSGAEKVEKILRQFRTAFGMFLGSTWQSEEVGARTIWHVTLRDFEFAHAIVGSRVFFTTGRARLKRTLALLEGAKTARLSGDETYRATRATMGAERAMLFLYANARAVYEQVVPMLGERERARADATLRLTGLDAIESLAVADVPAGAGLRTEFCVRLAERRGFFKLFQSAPTTHRFAGRVPREPLLYAAERFDTLRLVKDMVAWAEAIEPGSEAEYRALLARYDTVLGIDLEKDLFGSLGDEWAAYVGDTPGGSLIPDAVMLVSLKDRARFEKAVRALVERYPDVLAMYGKERAPRVRHRRTQFADHDIHLLELSTHRGDPIPIVPCWTIADDHVAFALWPHALKHLLSNRPSLDGNAAFAAILEQAPAGVVSTTYFDLPRFVGFAYNSVVPLLQGMQGAVDRKLEPFGASINLHDLPRAEVLTRHLTPCVSYTRVEERAIRAGYVSPFGVGTAIGAMAGLAGTAAIVSTAEKEEERAGAARLAERLEVQRLRELNRELSETLRAERKRWAVRLQRLEAQLEELARLIEEQK